MAYASNIMYSSDIILYRFMGIELMAGTCIFLEKGENDFFFRLQKKSKLVYLLSRS